MSKGLTDFLKGVLPATVKNGLKSLFAFSASATLQRETMSVPLQDMEKIVSHVAVPSAVYTDRRSRCTARWIEVANALELNPQESVSPNDKKTFTDLADAMRMIGLEISRSAADSDETMARVPVKSWEFLKCNHPFLIQACDNYKSKLLMERHGGAFQYAGYGDNVVPFPAKPVICDDTIEHNHAVLNIFIDKLSNILQRSQPENEKFQHGKPVRRPF